MVANDPQYMKERRNSPLVNTLAVGYLVILVVISIATIPLMLLTKAGA